VVLCDIEGHPAAFRQEGFGSCRAGSVVQLEWSPEHVHRFDKKTGARLDDEKQHCSRARACATVAL
jgi:hypothetical protein